MTKPITQHEELFTPEEIELTEPGDIIVQVVGRLSVRPDSAQYFVPPEARVPSNYKEPVKIARYAAEVAQSRQAKIATFPWCLQPEELMLKPIAGEAASLQTNGDATASAFVDWMRQHTTQSPPVLYGLGVKQIYYTCLFSALREGTAVPALWLMPGPRQLIDPLRKLRPDADMDYAAILQALNLPAALAEMHLSGSIVFLSISQQYEYLQAISRLLPPR